MKRTILNGFLFLAALLVGGACQNDDMEFDAPIVDADSFNLVTRAEGDVPEGTIAGDDAYNENTVTHARVYFFPANQAQTAQSVFEWEVSSVTDGKTLSIKVDNTMYDQSYDIYVVANAPAGVTWPEGHTTLAALKELQFVTTWKAGGESSLLMDGLLPNQAVIKGEVATVDMTRAMAKVTLKVNAAESLEIDNRTYTPDYANMSVELVNSVTKTQLDGKFYPAVADYTGITQNYKAQAGETGTTYAHAPLYSYPNPAEGAAADRKNTYLTLHLPWRWTTPGEEGGQGSQGTEDYYYIIPVTRDLVANMERNHYYDLSVEVKVLGSLDPNKAVELTPTIYIRNWFNMELESSIDKYQYLVLDEDATTLYNQTTYSNPYVTSSPITSVEVVSVKFYDYSEVNFREWTLTADDRYGPEVGEGWNQKRDDFNNYHASLDATNKTIIFRHDIDTDIMYAKREITIRVTNQDGLSRDWVVTQYPDMYIEGESNESRGGYNRFVYGVRETSNSGSSSVSDDNGSTRDNNLGGVYGYQNSDSNRNPNQYTIYVTALDSDSEYAIGDPRESTSVTARSLDLSDKTDYRRTHLQTYSLARGRDAANIIAPAFKIASSWGKTLPLSFEQAEKRCASYQENGYPAGRWRIPTEAEVAYVIKLSEDGKIPQLFDDAYWTSSGTSYGTSSQGTAVRCVYDVWYWGDQKEGDAANNYESFYWGSQTPSSN